MSLARTITSTALPSSRPLAATAPRGVSTWPACTTPSNSLTGPKRRATKGIPGTLEDLDRRRVLNETPPVEHHDTVREEHRLLGIVGDHESARIRAFEPAQRLHADLLPEVLVEPGEGLVEEQHLRPRGKRPKQGDALLLTARQGVRIALREVFETHLAQNPPHPRITARVGPRDSEGHVLTHREMGKERVVLEHEPDAARFRGDLAHVSPLRHETFSDPDPARLKRLEPGCETQHRGLAATRGAEQADDLARSHREAELAHRPTGVVAVRNLIEYESRHGRRDYAPLTVRTQARASCGPPLPPPLVMEIRPRRPATPEAQPRSDPAASARCRR